MVLRLGRKTRPSQGTTIWNDLSPEKLSQSKVGVNLTRLEKTDFKHARLKHGGRRGGTLSV